MVEVAGDARRHGITYSGSTKSKDSAHACRKAWPPATSERLVNRREAALHLNSVGVPHPAHNVTACRIPGTLNEELIWPVVNLMEQVNQVQWKYIEGLPGAVHLVGRMRDSIDARPPPRLWPHRNRGFPPAHVIVA